MSKAARDSIALEIFLKRMPTQPLIDSNRRSYEGAVEQAYEIADLFLAIKKREAAPTKEKA